MTSEYFNVSTMADTRLTNDADYSENASTYFESTSLVSNSTFYYNASDQDIFSGSDRNTMMGPGVSGHRYSIIFGQWQQVVIIGLYTLILILGLVFNAAIIWVILARPGNRNPRHMYIVNLASSGIVMSMVCVPPTLLQILYGGWWHLGLFACKLVPAFQGANILVSAFTIVVIAVDRWRSVVNTNPRDNNLSYKRVVCVILSVWILAFAVTSPLIVYQDIDTIIYKEEVLMQVCIERFPKGFNSAFTITILVVQYLMPLLALPVVHSKILIFLKKNSGFASDARRKEREVKRNRKMMMVLSGISVCFAISWLPLHLFMILTEHFTVFLLDTNTFYFVLGLCHAVALSSSFTNPVMYGWFNTSLRSELETLLPKAFKSNCLKRQGSTARTHASIRNVFQSFRRPNPADAAEKDEAEEIRRQEKEAKNQNGVSLMVSNCDLRSFNETSIITCERKLVPRREQLSGYSAHLMVSNWELNTIASSDRHLSPRRDNLPLMRQIDDRTITHLAVELAATPPKKRDIATNVPDVKSAPVSPSATQVITFIRAPAGNYHNGSNSSCDQQTMMTSV